MKVYVNGVPMTVEGPTVTQMQLVAMARGPGKDTTTFDVAYEHTTKRGRVSGSLAPGESVDVAEGMTFNVTNTRNA